MNTYEITVERTEVTILRVEANTQDEAEIMAMQRFATEDVTCGIGTTNITEIRKV